MAPVNPEGQTARGGIELLVQLRAAGWAVAVHNDYRLNGEPHTFWLFTKGDRCVKGEGKTDADALWQAWSNAPAQPSEGQTPQDERRELGGAVQGESTMKTDALEALTAALDDVERLEAVCARVLAGSQDKKTLVAGLQRAIDHAQSAKRLLAMLVSGEAAGLSKEGSET